MFRLRCFKRFRTTSFIALAALLICVVGAYTVHADHKSGKFEDDDGAYVQWYFGVNDVRAMPGSLQTNSYHYYWFQALSSRSVWGRWEFSHRVREGWNLGKGPVSIDISIDGNVKTLNHKHHTDSDSDYRRASYAGLPEGDYHIDAYTLLDLSVTGKGTAVNQRAKERTSFTWDGGGPN